MTEALHDKGTDKLLADVGRETTQLTGADHVLLHSITDGDELIAAVQLIADRSWHDGFKAGKGQPRNALQACGDALAECRRTESDLLASVGIPAHLIRESPAHVTATQMRAGTRDDGEATAGTLPLVKLGPGGEFTTEINP